MSCALRFVDSCVTWPQEDVWCEGGLSSLIDDRLEITRRTFLRHVDRNDLRRLEAQLGYGPHLHMAQDWHVEYFRSRWHGRRVYGFRHGAIEYVFASQQENEHGKRQTGAA